MNQQKFRVGIVGLQPGRSWAAMAHLPALRHLSDDFDVVGVANSSHASAQAAAAALAFRAPLRIFARWWRRLMWTSLP